MSVLTFAKFRGYVSYYKITGKGISAYDKKNYLSKNKFFKKFPLGKKAIFRYEWIRYYKLQKDEKIIKIIGKWWTGNAASGIGSPTYITLKPLNQNQMQKIIRILNLKGIKEKIF